MTSQKKREIREKLKAEKEATYRSIEPKIKVLNEQINELIYNFTEKELNELGWKLKYYYGPGQENMYEKNRREIRVALNFSYILTYSGHPTRQIEDVEDLNQYELTGK